MDKMVELLTSIAEPALNLFKPCGRRGPAVVAVTQPVDSKNLQHPQQLESPPESPRSELGHDALTVDQISSEDGSAVVAVKRDIVVINITSHSAAVCHKFLGSIFTILEDDGIPIDFVATSAVDCSLAINSATDNAARIDSVRGHLFKEGRVSVFPKMANLVLTVGEDSKASITVLAGRMLSLLSGNGIKVEMISKGTCVRDCPFCVSRVASGSMMSVLDFFFAARKSHDANMDAGAGKTKFYCVVKEKDVSRATSLLDTNLFDLSINIVQDTQAEQIDVS